MIRPWLQLLRLPNLLTVPGDPIAGALITGAAVDWRAPAGSLCLYAAGLISNDLFDAAEDARERPGRPLPSGRVSRPAAGALAVVLGLGGVGLAYLARHGTIGAVLLAAILLYNAGGKRIPVLGPANMGICRGLSLFLGASGLPWLPAGVLALYIAAVTVIARRETSERPVGLVQWLPALVLTGGFALVLRPTPLALIAAGVVVFIALVGGWILEQQRSGRAVPRVIGLWISALLPLQAAFCAAGSVAVAAVLLALWPVFRVLSSRFYAS